MRKADKAELARIDEELAKTQPGTEKYSTLQKQRDTILCHRNKVDINYLVKAGMTVGAPVAIYLFKKQSEKKNKIVDRSTAELLDATKRIL